MRNAYVTCDNIAIAYLSPEAIYNKTKNAGSLQEEFKEFSFKDFIGTAWIVACWKLKHFLIAPHYLAQMDHCMRKWDCGGNKGTGNEIIDIFH